MRFFGSFAILMRRLTLVFTALLLLLSASETEAQPFESIKLKTGDLIFQNLDCGGLCDAIEAVTQGFEGHKFSHIGLVYQRNDSTYIIEAMGPGVRLISLAEFKKRSAHKLYAGRLKPQYQKLVPAAIKYSLASMGIAYDDAFLYDNNKYYCSELIYDAFMKANNNKPFFKLEPMTFKQPGTKAYFPVWVDYYAKLHMPIPEGKEGINPGGISRSAKLTILNPKGAE